MTLAGLLLGSAMSIALAPVLSDITLSGTAVVIAIVMGILGLSVVGISIGRHVRA